MNDSKLAYQLNRQIYKSDKHTRAFRRTRLYTLFRNLRNATHRPIVLVKVSAKTAFTNPKKLFEFLIGKRVLNRMPDVLKQDKIEYLRWIDETNISEGERKKQLQESKNFKYRPLISLITPVYNPPVEAHNELIQTVVNQTYDNFELLLYNFSDNNDKNVKNLLDEWAERDSRIKVLHGLKNGHISANSNRALEDVKGEFIGLLDHDDALTENALYECVKVLNEYPDTDFIYTDKDKISESGERFEGFFKSDWSPEMILGGNYLTHFDLMRTSLVREVGGWNSETDGAQDWDLFLKITDNTTRIRHVPKIVYHWRIVQGSTAGGMAAKPYALKAQILAVKHHLDRRNIKAEPYHDEQGQSYIRWPMHKKAKNLFAIHCTYDDFKNAKKLLQILANYGYEVRVFVAKGLKKNEGLKKAKISKEKVVFYKPGYFASALKDIAEETEAESIVYLKDSIEGVEYLHGDNWVQQLTGWLNIEEVAVAGPVVYSDNGKITDMGSIYDHKSKTFGRLHYGAVHRSGYTGYSQWIRNFTKTTEQICAFKTQLLNNEVLSVRDDEFTAALALSAGMLGMRSVYDPTVVGRDRSRHYLILPNSENQEKLIDKCSFIKKGDQYFNINLSFDLVNPKPVVNLEDRGSVTHGLYLLDEIN